MQAVILAAGKGMRMRPLTDNIPKALLSLGKNTILDHTISQLPDIVEELIIVVGYLQEQIRRHVAEHYPQKKVVFVEETEAKGTGYALSVCRQHVRADFLVLNGDDLYDKADLERLIKEHWTFLVKELPDMERVGAIQIDDENNFIGIAPGTKGKAGLFNIGAYMLGSEYFDAPLVQTSSGEYGLPHTLLGLAKRGHKIKVMKANFWEPIGFPQDLENIRQRMGL